jgi:hypothetical protein
MALATVIVLGLAVVLGMGGLLVAWAIAPVIGLGLWLFAKGMKWM